MNKKINKIKFIQMHKGWENPVKAISFLAVFAILLSITSQFVIPKSNETLKQYSAAGFYGEPKDSIDYVVLGDSNTAEGISPLEAWKAYGYTGYVCGEPYQTICGVYHLLKEVLSCQSPKLVVFETDMFFAKNGMEEVNNAISNQISSVFPVERYHNHWKHLAYKDFISKTDYSWKHTTKGYKLQMDTTPFTYDKYMEETDQTAIINTTSIFYFNKLISLCKKNDISIFLLGVPCATSWDYAKHNAVSSLCAKKGLVFLDLNTEVKNSTFSFDWNTDSRDGGNHLNYYGAKKVSQYLADYFKQNYQLPDHRNDKSFSGWNEDLKTYEAEIAG